MITIRINTDNAAFGETAEEHDAEVCRILRELAAKIDGRGINEFSRIFDLNGNSVGDCRVT